ncbi:deoxyguanosinetriphosphate triphosphohydrolase [Alteromonas pelagimontana]|uniref:Deoxyguanosinetriphosphate triphosphohydrolase n=1 Tax=Alteromonas pelagimontana TaxID=1858656 RepID=A0A6M4M8Y0_9ALTE|nr:hypothetical protein [Alteromonas pelagimontana]QJR79439.1 deoxyguanosinetriphosphate triphosphohydrolase [Alteromonas pelagimontana]
MSSITAKAHNVVQLPLPFDLFPAQAKPDRGWSYLLAESLAFKKNVHHAIRIQKPSEEKVPQWIRKLIMSGQCKTIYVENLALPQSEKILIEDLCCTYSVSLVNLEVNDRNHGTAMQNVISGPW